MRLIFNKSNDHTLPAEGEVCSNGWSPITPAERATCFMCVLSFILVPRASPCLVFGWMFLVNSNQCIGGAQSSLFYELEQCEKVWEYFKRSVLRKPFQSKALPFHCSTLYTIQPFYCENWHFMRSLHDNQQHLLYALHHPIIQSYPSSYDQETHALAR